MALVDALAALLVLTKLLLATVSVICFVSGLDDFFIDVYHAALGLRRRLRRQGFPSLDELMDKPEQAVAIMIPAWDESSVIRQMLQTNFRRLRYANYYIFVGTYPNDTATAREVERVRETSPNVQRIVCPNDGPTNKADCLNWVYQGIKVFEKQHGITFDIIVMNDAEDVIHPLCLKIYNALIPDHDMVQLPVVPLGVPATHFTAGHYLDEFAENHAKDLVVREHLAGVVPGAGVGCAFSRKALEVLGSHSQNQLFNLKSLTEDYDIGFRLPQLGLKPAFVPIELTSRAAAEAQAQESIESRHAFVAIYEYFPSTYGAAVRQKARWLLGIAFQGWQSLGWQGSLAVKYFLYRDRKGLVTNLVAMLGYLLVVAIVGLWTVQWLVPDFYRFPALVERGSWLWNITILNAFFLGVRLVQRARFVGRLCGPRQALLAVPRQLWANVVNFGAVMRAYRLFIRSQLTGQPLRWEKTAHQFPSEDALATQHRPLGDLLLDQRALTVAQLDDALERQKQEGGRLGEVLLAQNAVREEALRDALASQSGLQTRELDAYAVPDDVLALVPAHLAFRYSVFPVERRGERLVLASSAPLVDAERVALVDTLGMPLELCLVTSSDLAFALNRRYVKKAGPAPEGARSLGLRLASTGQVTDEQVQAALRRQRRDYRRLGDLLVMGQLITRAQLNDALADFDPTEQRLGEYLVSRQLLSETVLHRVLRQQRARDKRLGDVLVEEGLFNRRELVDLMLEAARAS